MLELGKWALSSVGLAALAILSVVATSFTKRVLVTFFPGLRPVVKTREGNASLVTYTGRAGYLYNELFLYMVPYAWAAVFALSKSPFLFGSVDSYFGRLTLSFFVTTFSATIFKVVKKSVPLLITPTSTVVPTDDLFETVEDGSATTAARPVE